MHHRLRGHVCRHGELCTAGCLWARSCYCSKQGLPLMHAPCLALLPSACTPAGLAYWWCMHFMRAPPVAASTYCHCSLLVTCLSLKSCTLLVFSRLHQACPAAGACFLHMLPFQAHPLAACFCRVTSATKP